MQQDRHAEIVEIPISSNLMKTILFAPLERTVPIVTLLLASAFNQGLLAADPSENGKTVTKPVVPSSTHDDVHFNSIDGQPIRLSCGQ